MNQLPKDIENIILDYKYGLEHQDRFEKSLRIIKYLGDCSKCNVCFLVDEAGLLTNIVEFVNDNPEVMSYLPFFHYCLFKAHSI